MIPDVVLDGEITTETKISFVHRLKAFESAVFWVY